MCNCKFSMFWKQIQALKNKSQNKNLHLRVSVEGGGCSGFKYTFQMEDSDIQEDDRTFEVDGCKVVIDTTSFDFMKGATVDYVQEMVRSSFAVLNNPQSESACGCGSSFAVKNFASNPALD
mmetsp:Transcript_28481/g.39224  ORF Transcript_28481/g.39224 Transcript_28481/m.39224 type:complete len:121 (-) Transcript_28481:90-452(-)